jgi:hypothetical protein
MTADYWFMCLLYSLASFGFWWIIGRSRISLEPRNYVTRFNVWLVELIECPGCYGFWHGSLCGVAFAAWAGYEFLRAASCGIVLGCITTASNLLLFSMIGPALDRLEGEEP